jgi:O-antigen biosynthesis protein WbqP
VYLSVRQILQSGKNGAEMYQKYWKRILDIVLSGLAILTLSPLLAVIAVWIKLDSEGPVLFRQTRIGIHKTEFEILKFRTMRKDAPNNVPTHMFSDSHHWITRSGRFLRKASLDELPQLLQIFTGKMSFVGPRPALWNQYDLIAERDKNGANDVLPGLTGWAQVNGRDSLSVEEKARYDGEYAAHVTFGMDMKCIWKTVSTVITRKGFSEGKREDRQENRK